jgi:hypothetical protein
VIREYQDSDWPAIVELHKHAGLPEECLADVCDPLFLIRRVVTRRGEICMAAFVRLTSEPFLLVNHESGDPEERWIMLRELTEDVCLIAKSRGLLQLTCWIPPQIQDSFGRRLEALGFMRSPWVSYTRNL